MKSPKKITSRSNPEIQLLREIRDGKNKSFFFCEGEKLIGDLLRSDLATTHLYIRDSLETATRTLLSESHKQHIPITILPPAIIDYVSDMSTPPGVIAIAKRPTNKDWTHFSEQPLLLFLIGLQLPQNLGALLRTAEAAGVTQILVSEGSCDPYNPKALRGAAGSTFRLNISTQLEIGSTLSRLKENHIQILAAHQKGSIEYFKAAWSRPTALIVGAEGKGLSDSILQEIDATVKIPMLGRVESLNAGVAAALCLYEAFRQRSKLEK